MEIVDDILFFCGNYHSSTVHYGIVGWFDLNLFMAGTFSPHVITIPPVYDLSKMVAYQSASGYKVVAVGNENTTYLQVIATQAGPPCPSIDKIKVINIVNDNTTTILDPLIWQSLIVSSSSSSLPIYYDAWWSYCSH